MTPRRYLEDTSLPDELAHSLYLYDNPEDPLPEMNVKLVKDVWEWMNFKQGKDGQPVWYQWDFVADLDLSDTEERESYFDLVPEAEELLEEKNYCGTACCVAGYVMLDVTDTHDNRLVPGAEYQTPTGKFMTIGRTDPIAWDRHAKIRIGLTDGESHWLFSEHRTMNEIRDGLNAMMSWRGIEETLS